MKQAQTSRGDPPNVKHAQTPSEDPSRQKLVQPSRDARRKGRPMRGDTSVNSDAPEGLQFTFINDSESGKMNLVGVSKPSRSLTEGAHPWWWGRRPLDADRYFRLHMLIENRLPLMSSL